MAYDKTQELVDHLQGMPFDRSAVNLERSVGFVFAAVRDTYLEKELALQERVYLERLASARGGLLAPAALEARVAAGRALLWESAAEASAAAEAEVRTKAISLEDLELSKFMLAQNLAALSRCTRLSHSKDVASNVTTLYRLFLRVYGSECMLRAVDLHLELMPEKPNLKKPFDATFLYVALTVNSVVLDLERYHHMEVLPRVSRASINEPTKCNSLKSRLLQQLEQKVSQGLQRLVGLMVTQVEMLLSSLQARRDFRPAESVIVSGPTRACLAVCDFLNQQLETIRGCLDGGNADMFLRSLGSSVHATIFGHLRHFTVSTGLGGSQLMMDVARYSDAAKRFGVGTLDIQFGQLRSLANIHLVDQSSIQMLVKDLIGSGVPPADLRAYLETHESYTQHWNEYIP